MRYMAAAIAVAAIGLAPASAQPVTAELAALRAMVERQGSRLQQLEDIQTIERLQRAYGYYVDKHLCDQVVDVAPEGSADKARYRTIVQVAGFAGNRGF